jgi:hypothetical protein
MKLSKKINHILTEGTLVSHSSQKGVPGLKVLLPSGKEDKRLKSSIITAFKKKGVQLSMETHVLDIMVDPTKDNREEIIQAAVRSLVASSGK